VQSCFSGVGGDGAGWTEGFGAGRLLLTWLVCWWGGKVV
jgi:hypothetical protein